MGPKRVLITYGVDVDAVAGWLGSYGSEDSPNDISRGIWAVTVGTRRLLKLFNKYDIKTTWFIPGHSLETFLEDMAAVRDAGHEIGLHGYSHENTMSIKQQRDVLDKTYRMLTEFAGKPPRGSVAPCAAISAFLPVISEMRKPKDYPKAVYLSKSLVTASYLTFSLIIYAWCGKLIASPSLGSAGPTIERVAYGVALPGLMISGCLYVHVAAKSLGYCETLVICRPTRLLIGAPGWAARLEWQLFPSSLPVPFLSSMMCLLWWARFVLRHWQLVSLAGYGYIVTLNTGGPLYQKVVYGFHIFLILLGAFMAIGGTYGVIVQINGAYRSGKISGAFAYADNSAST